MGWRVLLPPSLRSYGGRGGSPTRAPLGRALGVSEALNLALTTGLFGAVRLAGELIFLPGWEQITSVR
jgi:hypothetical protein